MYISRTRHSEQTLQTLIWINDFTTHVWIVSTVNLLHISSTVLKSNETGPQTAIILKYKYRRWNRQKAQSILIVIRLVVCFVISFYLLKMFQFRFFAICAVLVLISSILVCSIELMENEIIEDELSSPKLGSYQIPPPRKNISIEYIIGTREKGEQL